jgi:hypothetical protein
MNDVAQLLEHPETEFTRNRNTPDPPESSTRLARFVGNGL